MNTIIYRIIDIRSKQVVYIGRTERLTSSILTCIFKCKMLKLSKTIDLQDYVVDWYDASLLETDCNTQTLYMKAIKTYQPLYCGKPMLENAKYYPKMTAEERKNWKPLFLYHRSNSIFDYDGFQRSYAIFEVLKGESSLPDSEKVEKMMKEIMKENAKISDERFRKQIENKILSSYPEEYYDCLKMLREKFVTYFEDQFPQTPEEPIDEKMDSESLETETISEESLVTPVSEKIPKLEEVSENQQRIIQALENGLVALELSISTQKNLLKTMNLLLAELKLEK